MSVIHRTDTVLVRDGELTLDHLPFRAGQSVEVLVVPIQNAPMNTDRPLRGTVVRFENPSDPVDEASWDVLR